MAVKAISGKNRRFVLFLLSAMILLTSSSWPGWFFWRGVFKEIKQHEEIIRNEDAYKLRLIYTRVDRDENNQPSFKTHEWRKNSSDYFYPASAVKLPVALMTAEKLEREYGMDIHASIQFDTGNICGQYKYSFSDDIFYRVKGNENLSVVAQKTGIGVDQLLEANIIRDTSTLEAGGLLLVSSTPKPADTIEKILSKMLVFSDNVSYNYLYDLLGYEYMNNRLDEAGYQKSMVINRFLNCDSLENAETRGFMLVSENREDTVFQSPQATGRLIRNVTDGAVLGQSHWSNGAIVRGPKDFSYRNNIPLADLHQMLVELIFPDQFNDKDKFRFSAKSRECLIKYLSTRPDELNYQDNNIHFYREDGFRKYLFVGAGKDELPEHVRIINIVGLAYGFLTDCAYYVDFENNIEFFLSASLYTNENQVMGDNVYEYYSKGFPFLKDIGLAFVDQELERRKKHDPDLTELKNLFGY